MGDGDYRRRRERKRPTEKTGMQGVDSLDEEERQRERERGEEIEKQEYRETLERERE